METGGRMTRSRAKAMGSTPGPTLPANTPENNKTTGRKRGSKGSAQAQEQPQEQKQLQFDVPATEPRASGQQDQKATVPDEATSDVLERSFDQVADADACSGHPNDDAPPHGAQQEAEITADAHDTHDDPSVLMASPIVLMGAGRAAIIDEAIMPMPLSLGQGPNDDSEPAASSAAFAEQPSPAPMPSPAPAPSPMPMLSPVPMLSPAPAASPAPAPSPLGLGAGAPAPSPAPLGAVAAEGSPMPAGTPLSFMSDARGHAFGAAPSPLGASMPATPLSCTSSFMEAVDDAQFSPLSEEQEEQQAGSPISLAGAGAATPQAQQPEAEDFDMFEATPQPGAAPVAASPRTFASDRHHATPAAGPSPMAGIFAVPDSMPHAAAFADVQPRAPDAAVSFQGFAPLVTGAGSSVQVQAESPSLDGLLPPAAPSAGLSPSPSPYSMQPTLPPLDQLQAISFSPLPASDGTPASNAAAGAATPAPLASPLEAASVLRAPSTTPELGAAASPAWALSHTPLVGAIAALPAEEDEDMAAEQDEQPAYTEEEQLAIIEAEAGYDMMEEAEATTSAAPTEPTAPASAKTPENVRATPKTVAAGRTPSTATAAAAAARTGLTASKLTPTGAKTPAVKMATPAAAGTSAASKLSSPYVHIESRYMAGSSAAKSRTPLPAPAAAAASTPAAPTNAAAGAKSAKRVSIHTPEGPRSTAPLRQVVATPYRPKSAVRAAAPAAGPAQAESEEAAASSADAIETEEVVAQVEAAEPQPIASVSAAVAEERRSKAAGRLKAIHDAESGVEAPVPGYLATTQAFAVKATKTVRSKVEAESYDPRSLRQLKRDIKDAVAKKEKKETGLTAARDTKLTPKVAERPPLPLVPDEEESDKEAEYDESQENALVAAMGGLEVAPPKAGAPLPLRGLAPPQGRHLRFNDKGKATESPQRTVLRGLPVATGKYKRFV